MINQPALLFSTDGEQASRSQISCECLVPGTMINWINFIGRFGQFQQQALKNLQAFFRDDYSDKPFFVISTLGGSFFASRPNA